MFEMPVEIKSRPYQVVVKSQPMRRKRSKSSPAFPLSTILYNEIYCASQEDCKRYNEVRDTTNLNTRSPSPAEPAALSSHYYNKPKFLQEIQSESPPRDERSPVSDSSEPVWGHISMPLESEKRAKKPVPVANSKSAPVPAPAASHTHAQQHNTHGFTSNGNSQIATNVYNAILRDRLFFAQLPVQALDHHTAAQQFAYSPPMQQYASFPVPPQFVPPSMDPMGYYPEMQPACAPQFVQQYYGSAHTMQQPAQAPPMEYFGPAAPMQGFVTTPMFPPNGSPPRLQQHGPNSVMSQYAPAPTMPHVSPPQAIPPSLHFTQSLASDGILKTKDRVRRQGKKCSYLHARSQETRLERDSPNGPERYKDYKNIMIGTGTYVHRDQLDGLVELLKSEHGWIAHTSVCIDFTGRHPRSKIPFRTFISFFDSVHAKEALNFLENLKYYEQSNPFICVEYHKPTRTLPEKRMINAPTPARG